MQEVWASSLSHQTRNSPEHGKICLKAKKVKLKADTSNVPDCVSPWPLLVYYILLPKNVAVVMNVLNNLFVKVIYICQFLFESTFDNSYESPCFHFLSGKINLIYHYHKACFAFL